MERSSDYQRGHVVHGANSYLSAQGPEYTPGVSAETVGAKSLFLGVVTLAAGLRTSPHYTSCTSPRSTCWVPQALPVAINLLNEGDGTRSWAAIAIAE
jgi:uncharacterized RmlC-like cupin family protein